jgi:hypothetical protein
MYLFGSSKAAINRLTKSWAAEYGHSGVRVNAVSPGPTRTEGTEAMGGGLEQLAAQAPVGVRLPRRNCRGHCLSSDGSVEFHLRSKTCCGWRPHRRLTVVKISEPSTLGRIPWMLAQPFFPYPWVPSSARAADAISAVVFA